MPRRIIYIENPSQGSNFRMIDGGEGGGGNRPAAKKPKRRTVFNTPQPLFNQNGTPYIAPVVFTPNVPQGVTWNWQTMRYEPIKTNSAETTATPLQNFIIPDVTPLQPQTTNNPYAGLNFGTPPNFGTAVNLPNFILNPVQLAEPYIPDMVGWIQNNVSTETFTSESPISGKTEKTRIVIKGIND